jgi:flagellar hook-associated protein 2
MLDTINNSAAGVTMSYNRLTDGFTITTKETGATKRDAYNNIVDNNLIIVNGTGNAFGVNSAFGIEDYFVSYNVYQGTNAVAYINGTRIERESNTFRVDGVQYALNYTTGTESAAEILAGKLDPLDTANNDPTTAINITLTKDTDSAFNKIKAFIDGYNAMLRKLDSLVKEKKDSKYYALTEEEKAGMTEKQIEQWEGFAKSGLLHSDRDIQRLMENMRSAFYSTVKGAGLSPQQIGLGTAKYTTDEGKYVGGTGEIIINEGVLRAALEKDSNAVMRVFMDAPFSSNQAERGLIYRLSDIIDDYTKGAQSNTFDSQDRSLNMLNDRIGQMETRMRQIEEKYYRQYAALESVMAKMNSQSDWLNSVMAGLYNNKK